MGGTAQGPTEFGHPERHKSHVILSDPERSRRGVEEPAVASAFVLRTTEAEQRPVFLFPVPCFYEAAPKHRRVRNRSSPAPFTRAKVTTSRLMGTDITVQAQKANSAVGAAGSHQSSRDSRAQGT
jgi:hypothetical protein